ncbi:maleylpyruvate isomerase N-terminal domain-containing protein [Streptomyces sp. TRM68416]|uniref:maleylpyruvate isomerase N-terminal domain-containing protein n=1 Tax=Streptomyces sp. TRM68416 TaxID=2758412 RepID=UPI001CB6C7AD|nr:maleylpyruvate isomerase N-terminal domain-containing protein [Streptomyces sp. TRM68416]
MTVTATRFAYDDKRAAGRWSGLLTATAQECLAVLHERAGRDWTRPAHGLDWTCRQTLGHLALGLTGYAGLLIARPQDRYVALHASLDPEASVDVCLEGVGIAASLLARTVDSTPGDVRAWHPWGHSDSSGFAAMGAVELALHTYDITAALGTPHPPSDSLAEAVLSRLFPEAPPGHRPCDTLLWSTGRAALPGLGRRSAWQWDGTVR